jgi:hypothetical protein
MNSIIVLTIDLLCPILLFHSDCLTLDDFMCWERELLLNGLSHNSWVSLRHYAVNLTGGEPQMCWCLLYRSVKIIRNSMYLPPNTRLTHKMNNRLTLITVFCFRVDPPSLLWHHMKPNNSQSNVLSGSLYAAAWALSCKELDDLHALLPLPSPLWLGRGFTCGNWTIDLTHNDVTKRNARGEFWYHNQNNPTWPLS